MNESEDILEFGIKRENEERRDGGCGIIFDPETQKYAVGRNLYDNSFRLFGGGVELNEDMKDGIIREIVEESGLHDFLYVEDIGKAFCHYHNKSKNVNRCAMAHFVVVVLNSKKLVNVKLEEHENFILEWASFEDIISSWQLNNVNQGYDHWIHFFKKAVKRAIELGHDKTSSLELS